METRPAFDPKELEVKAMHLCGQRGIFANNLK